MVLLMAAAICCLAGCGDQVTEDDVQAVLDQKDAAALTALIKQYSEGDGQSNQKELNQLVLDFFETLCGSDDYQDFKFIDRVSEQTASLQVGKKGVQLLEDNRGQMIRAFMSGDWVRKDMSNLDGCIVTMKWDGDTGQAAIKDTSGMLNNDQEFQEGEMKWENVKLLQGQKIQLDDMEKRWGSVSYGEGTEAEIYFQGEYLVIHNDDFTSSYYGEGDQIWMRQSYLDSFEKDGTLDDSDFVISGDSVGETDYDLFEKEFSTGEEDLYTLFYYDAGQDQSKEGVVRTSRGITLGSAEQDVTKAYGMGSRGYFDGSSDVVCRLAQHAQDEASREQLQEHASYYLHYTVKEKDGAYIRFYFDQQNQVTAIVFGNEYPGNSAY